MKLGFTCTNYNNAGFTAAALRTLHAQTGSHDLHVAVVDNGSGAADLERLRELQREFPRVDFAFTGENLGYFPGLNLGMRRLRARVPDLAHIVVGNNDLEFPPGFLDSVARHADVFERWAVVAPDLVTPTGVHQNPLVREPITRARQLVWALYYQSYAIASVIAAAARATHRFTARPERVHGDTLSRTPGPVIMGYGACYLLGPRFFEHFERLYAPTFLMQEEFFLSAQLGAVGQQVYYDPRFVVHHRDHASFDVLPSRRVWDVSRDSYRTYRAFLATSRERQLEMITRATSKGT